MSTLHVTKLDVARRQLEVAVRLYFNEVHPVAVHTLAAAAYNVLRDVNLARSGSPMIVKDRIDEYVKPEFVSELRKKINEAENFFKHADRDPDRVLEFRPGLTEFFLLDACEKYRQLTGEAVPEFILYTGWLSLQKPDAFILPPEGEALRSQIRSESLSFGRARFFAEMLPVVTKQGIVGP